MNKICHQSSCTTAFININHLMQQVLVGKHSINSPICLQIPPNIPQPQACRNKCLFTAYTKSPQIHWPLFVLYTKRGNYSHSLRENNSLIVSVKLLFWHNKKPLYAFWLTYSLFCCDGTSYPSVVIQMRVNPTFKKNQPQLEPPTQQLLNL